MVHLEFLAVTLLQGVENLLMISPLMHLYSKISERHDFLTSTVGPTALETEAINSVRNFTYVCLSVVLLLVPLQIAFYWLYNLIGHPWKRFLNQIYLEEEVQFPGMIGPQSQDDDLCEKNFQAPTKSGQDILSVDTVIDRGSKEIKELVTAEDIKDNVPAKNETSANNENGLEMDNLMQEDPDIEDLDATLDMLREIVKY